MSVSIHVELERLKEAQQKLENMARSLSGDAVFGAVQQSTLIVQRDAKINSPVKTGALRASIIPSISSSGSTVIGIVGTNIFYAGFQEFGTKYIKARRYLGRALEDNRDRIVGMIQAAIRSALS